MIITLLRTLLRCMPTALADKVYSHFLRGHAQRLPGAFHAAPLRLCPSLSMNLTRSDTAHGHLALVGVYEPELSAIFTRLSKEGGLLVDVGANFGYFSLLWCGLGRDNRSIAFEASPRVLSQIKTNISLNKLDDRIDLREMAAANIAGTLFFDTGPPEQTGWGGISSDSSGDGLVKVPAVRLDDVITAPEIALLKIDCEGADYLVLQGAEQLLRQKRVRHVCFEENVPRMQKLGIEPGSAAQYVRSLGYQCETFGEGSEYHAWV